MVIGPRRPGARRAVVANGRFMRGRATVRAATARMAPAAFPVHCSVHRIRRLLGLETRCSRYVLFARVQAVRGRATKGRGSSLPAARRTVEMDRGNYVGRVLSAGSGGTAGLTLHSYPNVLSADPVPVCAVCKCAYLQGICVCAWLAGQT